MLNKKGWTVVFWVVAVINAINVITFIVSDEYTPSDFIIGWWGVITVVFFILAAMSA